MNTLAFDTLAVTKRLKSHGFSEAQAEAITEEIQNAHDCHLDNLATKGDIRDTRAEMREIELRLKITIGTMIVGLGAFLAAIKFFG